MHRRSRGRELALQYLYEFDLLGQAQAEPPEAFLVAFGDTEPVAVSFFRELVYGVFERREALDALITRVAENWRLDRMAVVDRNILRLAAWEMLHCPATPPKVALDEAIELAKRFSTAESGSFVNGILDRILIAERGTSAAAEVAHGALSAEAPPAADGLPASRPAPPEDEDVSPAAVSPEE